MRIRLFTIIPVLAASVCGSSSSWAQDAHTAVSAAFVRQATPTIAAIAGMAPRSAYSAATVADLDRLYKLAKSEAEIHQVSFLQQDMASYIKTEKKPAETVQRKRCLSDMTAQNARSMFDATSSKACSAITDAVF